MIKSAVTISLVPSLSGGPWIYWDKLEASIPEAKETGFDGIELFTASAEAVNSETLSNLLSENEIKLSAAGSGAGRVLHQLHLTHPKSEIRGNAQTFIKEMIDFAGPFGAPVIIGSMQGELNKQIDSEETYSWLAEGLINLAKHAATHGVKLIYEPLNRYETNIFNRLEAAVAFLNKHQIENVGLLADLFHMNIEEQSIPETIRATGDYIGYVHFADSNRRPIGLGHTNMAEIARALIDIGYDGFVSAEAFAYPDPNSAAQQTIESFRKYFNR
jgi:sugar phosphate isomerase/epimerase